MKCSHQIDRGGAYIECDLWVLAPGTPCVDAEHPEECEYFEAAISDEIDESWLV